ncbi:S8 family serine peptidase [Streptomyces tsukubensis]|uniref:Serine protease n=2 Tax=Streptomyces TaxID=1883 RepID=I2N7C6_STRT9|nr:serine protease [Streptomyces tsukubensis]EIF92923.1 peptidase S8 and S53 subtilisin kexin sedolisin [Streptomyces tsukubensis NRRL18488]MYS64631.1 S8 family serine peptidase [Streptomyces sp. SID5473]QKM67166.1 serine protease [Streptomyces tsukubensis NRRL18488]TAI41870.1 serine protease [Streptomyces tsukubensis]
MTAGMIQMQKQSMPRALRQGMLCTLAAACVWAGGALGAAPAAAAAGQPGQWYLDAMGAAEMWKVTTGKGITVAVVDTGVNATTPSLRGQVVKGFDATEAAGTETDDYNGHGTTMAEMIAGTGKGGGLQGLAPGAKIMPMRIANTEFQNENKVNAQDSADAIRAAADSEAKIINVSFASEFSTSQERAAVEYAHGKGKLIFAGAGNNARTGNKPQYPASYPDAIGVASADKKGTVAEHSQHGDNVDITAPGTDVPVWCDESFQKYCKGSGTSAATAIASASAALVWSAHPDWTANQVLRALIDTAGRSWAKGTRSNYLGHGLIRPAQIVVDKKGDPGAPDISPLTNQKTGASPAASASPSAPASSQQPKGNAEGDTAVTGSSKKAEKKDSSNTGLIIGGVAAVVVLAGGAFFFLRRRTA